MQTNQGQTKRCGTNESCGETNCGHGGFKRIGRTSWKTLNREDAWNDAQAKLMQANLELQENETLNPISEVVDGGRDHVAKIWISQIETTKSMRLKFQVAAVKKPLIAVKRII